MYIECIRIVLKFQDSIVIAPKEFLRDETFFVDQGSRREVILF